MVTTNDRELADKLRSMRDYGKGTEDEGMVHNGLSARMSELHAAVGLLSLRNADHLIAARMRLIEAYRWFATGFKRCRVQDFPDDRTTSGNYFTLLIGEGARSSRDEVYEALKAEGIQSKKYFHPPVHVQPAFKDRPNRIIGDLRNTWEVTRTSLALPLFAHMTDEQQERVCNALNDLLG
jgi:dTDP-4-amino-4,6-dideoxygalactose transaminase